MLSRTCPAGCAAVYAAVCVAVCAGGSADALCEATRIADGVQSCCTDIAETGKHSMIQLSITQQNVKNIQIDQHRRNYALGNGIFACGFQAAQSNIAGKEAGAMLVAQIRSPAGSRACGALPLSRRRSASPRMRSPSPTTDPEVLAAMRHISVVDAFEGITPSSAIFLSLMRLRGSPQASDFLGGPPVGL